MVILLCLINRTNVSEFFSNYHNVLDKNKFQSHQIWNADETGLSTVHVPPRVFAEKGTKQVGGMTSAERGQNVTMIACINAVRNSIPPMFIFPRVNFKQHMLKGAPPGSVGAANLSGWSNEKIFLQFFNHFIAHAKPNLTEKHLLIFDNHESHISIPLIEKAKECGVVILTIPPHISHKLQPLDKSVCGPFKSYYNTATYDWMNSPENAAKPVTIYEVAELAGRAYDLAFVPKHITNGFRGTGIVPLNSEIFSDHDFLSFSVTDRDLPSVSNEIATEKSPLPVNSEENTNNVDPQLTSHTSGSNNIGRITPEVIRPFLKAGERKTNVKRRRLGKSRILTDTPQKMEIEATK